MANIATLLARILTTRYGRDMRQDLHDSIEAVNDDTETALGKKLTFATNTRKLKLLAKDDTVLSEVVIPGGGSGGGSVDSVNGLFPDENGNVEVNLDDINDVAITSATGGQTLVYDATSGKWVNGSGGGGTTDYSDLTNKPSVNGVTLSGNKTSGDLGLQSELTFTSTPSANNKVVCQNDLPSGGGSNRNLLDNPWFTVNQKGFSSETITDSNVNIKVDRWNIKSATVTPRTWTLNSNGLTCSISNSTSYSDRWRETYLIQYLEDISFLVGKTVTMSVICNGELYSGSVYIANTTTTYTVKTANLGNTRGLELRIYMSTNSVGVSMSVNMQDYTSGPLDFTFKAMKLELGSESTLALDVAPSYTEELLKCQRYYYPLVGKSYNSMVSAMQQTRQFMTITLPTEMRAVPTLSGSLTTEGISGSTRVDDTVTSSNITVTNKQDIEFNFTTSNNFNLCSSARVSFASGSYLSAEL